MLKRIGVVMAAAMLGVVALTGPASSQPEPRFTLTINPTQGPVGTNIHAQLPAEAFKTGGECKSPNEIVAQLQTIVGQVVGGFTPNSPEAILGALAQGQLPGPSDLDLTLFYVLVFADPATQRPAIDQTTGQESATSFWNPANGQGDITAPPAQRPKTYFVAGVCLDLNTNPDPAAVAAALQSFITATPGLLPCLQSGDPSGCIGDNAQKAVTPLITALIDQNAKIAWVAPFCLLGDNGEGCGGPTAAEAVPGEPAFTG